MLTHDIIIEDVAIKHPFKIGGLISSKKFRRKSNVI